MKSTTKSEREAAKDEIIAMLDRYGERYIFAFERRLREDFEKRFGEGRPNLRLFPADEADDVG